MNTDISMSAEPRQIVVGKPDFLDPELSRIARESGYAAAWATGFERHGLQILEKVSGHFAIALQHSDGSVFMATDRFATEPLWWAETGGKVIFARRPEQLMEDHQELELQAIYSYLYFHVVPSPRSIYVGISKLPPAHTLYFDRSGLKVKRYWPRDLPKVGVECFNERKTQFLSILENAVRRRCASVGRTSCFLSGGTDSSTVAGMIGRVTGAAASTYSIGFDKKDYDEMEYARLSAKHFGTAHHEYYVTPDDLVSSISMVAAHYDQPFGNSSALPAYYCARMAADNGAREVLAGDGGDELFGGNTRYSKQRVFEAWRVLPQFARVPMEMLLADSGAFDKIPLARKLASYIRQARVPLPDRMQSYNLIEHLGLSNVLSRQFIEGIDIAEPIIHQRETYSLASREALIDRMLAFDWRYTLAENDLPKVVGTCNLAGVEARFPLLDPELVDFSLGLPGNYKIRGLRLRWFFKEALRGFLPEATIKKKKHGFGLPFGAWAVDHAPLRNLAINSLNGLVDRGLLNDHFVRKLFSTHLASHPGYYGEFVWVAMMLEQWLRVKSPNWKV